MHLIDYLIFAVYMGSMLGVGYYFFRRNKSTEDYYVGSRSIPASHVGLSIVATDVGGGFSIGLGGLGFTMGLAGSWMLFTGLIGAWLSAVFIIPRIKALDVEHNMMTYPDFLRWRYGGAVALLAALISGIGYLGFTGAQILAGAKLASGTFMTSGAFGLSALHLSLIVIAFITIVYTVIGGLKAVIYTDSIQWVILLSGLILVTIPVAVFEIGGLDAMRRALPAEFFSLGNIDAHTLINWMVIIVPIWLIGMTLYQRMYACKNAADAKKAWFIAGLFEYPVMAFAGVVLGMCARVVFPNVESEMGLPMLIKEVLPIGVTGIVIASYFSAIMSTADSCLMAASGNFVNDILQRFWLKGLSERALIHVSQLGTLVIGVLAVVIAAQFEKVLDAMLYAYGFMVAGLFVPTLGAYFWKRSSATGAFAGMLGGGLLNTALQAKWIALPAPVAELGLDPTLYGILCSALLFVILSLLFKDTAKS